MKLAWSARALMIVLFAAFSGCGGDEFSVGNGGSAGANAAGGGGQGAEGGGGQGADGGGTGAPDAGDPECPQDCNWCNGTQSPQDPCEVTCFAQDDPEGNPLPFNPCGLCHLPDGEHLCEPGSFCGDHAGLFEPDEQGFVRCWEDCTRPKRLKGSPNEVGLGWGQCPDGKVRELRYKNGSVECREFVSSNAKDALWTNVPCDLPVNLMDYWRVERTAIMCCVDAGVFSKPVWPPIKLAVSVGGR